MSGLLSETYAVPECRARNNAALFVSDNASARTVGFTPLLARAARRTAWSYSVLRLFHRVLRFCPKESLRKEINSASGTPSESRRGSIVMRTTLECTFGGGAKASGESVKGFSTVANNWAVAESNP